jgi:formate hydrogenlyase subunit 3/multisubunit Na+/H+ antiporter MnhD subunit
MKYLGIVMALVYVGAGIALLVRSSDGNLPIPGHFTIPLGIVMIAYGAFRAYNTFKRYNE